MPQGRVAMLRSDYGVDRGLEPDSNRLPLSCACQWRNQRSKFGRNGKCNDKRRQVAYLSQGTKSVDISIMKPSSSQGRIAIALLGLSILYFSILMAAFGKPVSLLSDYVFKANWQTILAQPRGFALAVSMLAGSPLPSLGSIAPPTT